MFSIVVPVRDKPHTILRTLGTVLAQSFPDFELILVGDPGDESLAAASRIADPRIRIVHQPNIGQGPARNAGIEASRNEWIAFLDGDDLWLPDHLAELDSVRRAHPEAGLIGTRYLEGDLSERFEPPPDEPGVIARADYFESVGRGGRPLCSSSAAIRRAVYGRLGGFGATLFGEDSEYWARISFAFPVFASSRATAIYMLGTGGITDSGWDRWTEMELGSVRDISPAVALVVDRYRSAEPGQRRSLDLFIRRYIDWCLRRSVALRDFRTIRRLRLVYWGRPTPAHWLLLAIGSLPDGAASAAYALGFRLKALSRYVFGPCRLALASGALEKDCLMRAAGGPKARLPE